MKAKAHLLRLILFLSLGLLTSCGYLQDTSAPVDADKYDRAFWMHTEGGHAKDYYIQISLPRSYYESDTRTYPVLYLTDADFCFGMARDLAMVLDWDQREVIVVGIGYGSPERLSEYRWAEYGKTKDESGVFGCSNYLSFLEEQLIPKVESEYRANRHNRTLLTWSWGTCLYAYLLEQNTDLFHNYIMGGGGLDVAWVDTLYQNSPDLPVRMYFGIGDNDSGLDMFKNFTSAMEAKGFGGLETHVDIYPEKYHEMITIGDLIDRGMKWIYGRRSLEPRLQQAMKSGGIDAALEEYNSLKVTNSDDYVFNPNVLFEFAQTLTDDGNNEAKQAILEFIEQEYPKRHITICVLPNEMPESDLVYITGNLPELGNWNLTEVALEPHEDGSWSRTFVFRSGTEFEFKITRGSWETEAADSRGLMLQNYREIISGDTTIQKVVEKWNDLK